MALTIEQLKGQTVGACVSGGLDSRTIARRLTEAGVKVIGFTAELVTGVWMGNDDERPMPSVSGGGAPARLWQGFMTAALAGTPERALTVRAPEPRPAPALPEASLDQPGADQPGFFQRLMRVFGSG